MKLKHEQKVDLQTAEARALTQLARLRYGVTRASQVADAIWPGHEMARQGAGAAASRILVGLKAKGFAVWTIVNQNWGWMLTSSGRAEADRISDQ